MNPTNSAPRLDNHHTSRDATNPTPNSLANCDYTDHPLPALTSKLVMIKGMSDIGLALSLMFVPGFFYNGPMMEVLSDLSGLPTTSGTTNPTSAFELAMLVMGMGFAGISAWASKSRGGIKTIATMNAITSVTGLAICALSPYKHATTFILFLALMNGAWYVVITRAGRIGVGESLGLGGMCKGCGLRGCLRGGVGDRDGSGTRRNWRDSLGIPGEKPGYEVLGDIADEGLSEKRRMERGSQRG